MTDAGARRPRGRHASPPTDARGVPTSQIPSVEQASGRRAEDPWNSRRELPEPRRSHADRDDDTARWAPVRAPRRSSELAGASTGGMRRPGLYDPGLYDRGLSDRDAYDRDAYDRDAYDQDADETGPVPMSWRHRGAGDDGSDPEPATEDLPAAWHGQADDEGRHPSAPLPPPPPGAWSRLSRRGHDADDDPAHGGTADDTAYDDAATDAIGWEDRTGGLEVIGANVDEELPRRGRRRRRAERRAVGVHDDRDDHDRDDHDRDDHDRDDHDHDDHDHDDEVHADDLHDELYDDEYDHSDDPDGDGEIPLKPYDRRSGRTRRRRRPLAVLFALLVLGGLVAGVVFGGQKLLGLFVAEDYTGQGTGSVQIRVHDGDTLSDIGRTLVSADVIASVGPFTDAADNEPKAMGITAGVYKLRSHMSGAAALKLLLDPSSRLVSRVTIPEGTTAANTLQKVADATGLPLADLQAAAANPAALGLPAYANGSLEGFLFPATYDVEPGDTAAGVLSTMITRTVQALDALGVPEDQRLQVLTEASIVQAEAGSTEDMAKVARVLDNRLAIGMPLQLDTTVNYANGKTGLTTTPQDRQNPSPYNTYVHTGLPPGPIGNPGEDAIRAVLTPAQGDWLFFVVVNPDTGETRFATTAEEHQANVALFQQWLQAHPGG